MLIHQRMEFNVNIKSLQEKNVRHAVTQEPLYFI
jgi:hypothetical protein